MFTFHSSCPSNLNISISCPDKIEVATEDGTGLNNLFECSHCQKRFSKLQNARLHILVVHMKRGKKCPTCGNPFFDDQRLAEHIPKCSRKGGRPKVKNGERVPKVQGMDERDSVIVNAMSTSTEGRPGQVMSDNDNVAVKYPFTDFDLIEAVSDQVMVEPLSEIKQEENH